MHLLSLLCFIVGAIISLVYGIQLLILAFRTSVWWGLGYLFIPFVGLIFIIVHWSEAKGPFLKGLIALPCFLLGAILAPPSAGHH
jgi:Na+-translocating ferredoxin:NAD+ oxidoreductase RnfE subunit